MGRQATRPEINYQDVEGAGDDDGSVSAQVGVGEEGADQGHEACRARPGVDGGGGGGVGLPQRARQVRDQVRRDAEVGEAPGDLNACAGGGLDYWAGD